MPKETLLEEDIEASNLGGLPLDLAAVKATFTGMSTFVQEMPKLGSEVEFRIRGFVRKSGEEWLETEEAIRTFVQFQVISIMPVE